MAINIPSVWRYSIPAAITILLAIAASNQTVAITRLAPVSVEMIVNQVTASPRLDLPPLDQRPTLYAELGLDNESAITSTVETPQIGASAYPDWSIQLYKERVWIEPGHPVVASLRIFDQDQDDADDKVLVRALNFDPIACRVGQGQTAVRGDRTGSSCVLEIPDLQGENGSVRITLTSQW